MIKNAKKTEAEKQLILSKNQIENLLLNAYGFVDKHGQLFTTDKYLIDPYEFKLMGANVHLEFSYDNCTFADGKVTFETHDADQEQFMVIVIATDVVELISK